MKTMTMCTEQELADIAGGGCAGIAIRLDGKYVACIGYSW